MKKLLPFMGGALLLGCASVAQAQTPQKFIGAMLSRVSPNGEWAVSCGDGSFSVYNLKTGAIYETEVAEDDYDAFYEAGYGNPVSNDGIVVGSTSYSGGAAYWHITDDAPEGEWTLLPVLSESTNCAHGITPDGSRIVGTSSVPGAEYGGDSTYSVPLLWQRNDQGTYDMVELPYPEFDFTGKRAPQYVIVHAISNDGTRIVGQVTDYAGFMHTQIVYNEQADGSWKYEYVHPELQTLGQEFPDWEPYNGPSYPSATDYMTDDEYEQYYDATSAWDWQSGDPYPQVSDFMSEEELAAYQAAIEAYQTAYSAWSEIDDAFSDIYWGCIENGAPDFLMNTIAFSGNGQYLAASKADGDFWSGYTYLPYLFDLNSGDVTVYDDEDNVGICATSVSNNGDMLGAETALDGYLRLAYAKVAGEEKFTRLYDYVANIDAEVAEWMDIYLPGSVIVGFDDDYNYIYEDTIIDGLPVANEDMTTIVSWVYNMFAEDEDSFMYSVALYLPETSGIQGVAAATDKSFTVKASANGVITINGDAKTLEVFDLTGKSVYRNDAPAASVNTNLSAGIYLVKATSTNGKTAIAKAAFTE